MNAPKSIAGTDIALEVRYLGACIMRPDALEQAPIALEDLASPAHQHVLAAMMSVRGRREDVNTVSVTIELERQGRLQQVGRDRVMDLSNSLEFDPHACAKRIRELARRRRLINASKMAIHLATEEKDAEAKSALAKVAFEESTDDDPVLTFRGLLLKTYESLIESNKEHNFIPLGIRTLDRFYRCGPGDLVVIGAATGTGKSTFLSTVAMGLAKRGVPVGIISIEDGDEDYGTKAVSQIANVPSDDVWNNRAPSDRVLEAIDKWADAPLSFVRIRSRSLDGVLSRMAYMARVHNCKIVMVDYLQAILHRSSNNQASTYERTNEVLESLLAAAATLGVTLVLASQLKRNGQESQFREPTMNDLKESGNIENSAQCIVLLWRETDMPSHSNYGVVFAKVAKVKRARAGARFALQRRDETDELIECESTSSKARGNTREGWS